MTMGMAETGGLETHRRAKRVTFSDQDPQEGDPKTCCHGNCCAGQLSDVSVHGNKRMARSGRCSGRRRTFWIAVLLVSSAAFLYQLVCCLLHFLASPRTLSPLFLPEAAHIPVGVTLCNLNSLRLSAVHEHGWLSALRDLHTEGAAAHTLTRGNNASSREVFAAAGHSLRDMLVRCTADDQSCFLFNFTTTLTEHGLCYTMTNTNWTRLSIVLNIEAYEYIPFIDNGQGLLVLLHAADDHPAYAPSYAVAPGIHSVLDLHVQLVKRSTEGEGSCRSSVQSYSACVATSVTAIMQSECGCSPFWSGIRAEEPGQICSLASHILCTTIKGSPLQRFTTIKDYQCPLPCSWPRIFPAVTTRGLSSHNMDGALKEAYFSSVKSSVLKASNVRERVLPERDAENTADILQFSHSLADLNERLDIVKERMRMTSRNVDDMMQEMAKRSWFHFHVGLNGLRRSLSQGFVDGWDHVTSRLFRPLYSTFPELVSSYDRVVEQLQRTSVTEISMRKVLYFLMDERLSDKLELYILTLDNFTQVYYSFLNIEPSEAYILTPNRHYDSFLLPRQTIGSLHEGLKDVYKDVSDELTAYMEHLLTLKNVLKDAYQSKPVNETSLVTAKTAFVRSNIALEAHMSLFQAKVVDKLVDTAERQMEHFKKVNHTFETAAVELIGLFGEASDTLDQGLTTPLGRLKDFSQAAQQYLANKDRRKADLMDKWQALDVPRAMSDMARVLARLRLQDAERWQRWRRYAGALGNLWSGLLDVPDLHGLYARLQEDVQEMNTEPSRVAGYMDLFSHPKLLDQPRPKLATLPLTDFYVLLNADTPGTNSIRKAAEVQAAAAGLRRDTEVSQALADTDTVLEEAFATLSANLDRFRKETEVNSQFVRENIVKVEILRRPENKEEVLDVPVYPLFRLLADAGGLLALFLGASVLSLVEALDICVTNACCARSNHGDYDLAENEGDQSNMEDRAHPVGNHVPDASSRITRQGLGPVYHAAPRENHIHTFRDNQPRRSRDIHTEIL